MKIVRSDAIKGFEIHFWYICPDHVSEERGQEKILSVLLVLLFSLTIKLRSCKHVVFITVKLEVFFSCHDKKILPI